jgi:hypothetical protein
MKWASIVVLIIALTTALLFPLLRVVTVSPFPSRLRFYAWVIASIIVVTGAAFPIRSPRRLQSWLCAVLLWINAALFLLAALGRIALWYP